MSLLILEALGALLVLLLIVWWTMFSGRPGGELPPPQATDDPAPSRDVENRDKPDSALKP